MELRQSTSQVIRFGPFVDSTDGVTPETGLTIAQADMQLSKDGGAFAQKNASGNATHDVDGYYSTTLNTTDTGTLAILKLQITVAGSLLVWDDFDVVTQSYYDAKYSGTFNNLGGTAQTADHTAGIAAISLVVPPSVAQLNARTILAASYFDPVNDAVANVTLVATTTTNTDMRGTDGVDTATMRGTDGVDTATMRGTDGANTTVPDAAGTAPTLSEILESQLTEAYAADGVAPTLTQAIFLIQQALTEFAIAGTSNTVKRLNGSTTAAVMTLDDATDPTSSTRTS